MMNITLNRDYYHKQDEILAWTIKQFGDLSQPSMRWVMREGFGNQYYWFKYEQDAILFSLKWLGTSGPEFDSDI